MTGGCLPGAILYIQCEAPKIAKLVHITPITMVYGTYSITIVTGAFVNQLITGGPHIVDMFVA